MFAYPPELGATPLNVISFGDKIAVAEIRNDGSGGQIIFIDPDNFESREIVNGALGVPIGLAAINNDLYVSDWFAGMVLKVVEDGEILSQPIPIAQNLSYPEGLATDNKGNLLVVETGSGRLSRIDLSDYSVSTVIEGMELGFPAAPGYQPTWAFNGVTVASDGAIYVTGDINNVVYKITE